MSVRFCFASLFASRESKGPQGRVVLKQVASLMDASGAERGFQCFSQPVVCKDGRLTIKCCLVGLVWFTKLTNGLVGYTNGLGLPLKRGVLEGG